MTKIAGNAAFESGGSYMETTKEFKERIKNNHNLMVLLMKMRPDLTYKSCYLYVLNMDTETRKRWDKIVKANMHIIGGIK